MTIKWWVLVVMRTRVSGVGKKGKVIKPKDRTTNIYCINNRKENKT